MRNLSPHESQTPAPATSTSSPGARNARGHDQDAQMAMLVKGMEGRRLPYRVLIQSDDFAWQKVELDNSETVA